MDRRWRKSWKVWKHCQFCEALLSIGWPPFSFNIFHFDVRSVHNGLQYILLVFVQCNNIYTFQVLITACWPGGWNLGHRMKVYEKGMKSLLMEAEALKQEVAICKSNLKKAQEQVHSLQHSGGLQRCMTYQSSSRLTLQSSVGFICFFLTWGSEIVSHGFPGAIVDIIWVLYGSECVTGDCYNLLPRKCWVQYIGF